MNQEAIDNLIDQYYIYGNGKEPFYDGVINEDAYNTASTKILWVGQEPYGEGNRNDKYCFRTELNRDPEEYYKFKIFRRVAITSYCLINNCSYADVLLASNVPNILKSIAFINVNKIPAESKSNNRYGFFDKVYNKYNCKEVLLKQIENYNPDVLIFFNVLYLFKELQLDPKEGKNLEIQNKSVFHKNGKLYIDSYHASYRGISEENFCKSIIEAVNKYKIQ